MEKAVPEAGQPKPFEGLYGFIRHHLTFVNAVVLFASTMVAAIDFLITPKFVGVATIIYSLTAMLVVTMLAAAAFPIPLSKALSKLGIVLEAGGTPLWKRPVWRLCLLGLLGVSLAGFASVAHTTQGGMIASRIPAARSLQESLLGLSRDVADVKLGVDAANTKLDRLITAVDPDNPADRCADLECAISGRANAKAVRRLFEKGAKTSGNSIIDGAMLMTAALSGAQDRLETMDILFQHGFDRNLLLLPTLLDKSALSKQGASAASRIVEAARLHENPALKFRKTLPGSQELDDWKDAAGCLARSSGGVSLLEVAVLQGDTALYAHLINAGAKLPNRPLACKWKVASHSGGVIVEIDPANGQFRLANSSN
jgi:hypothetical protein